MMTELREEVFDILCENHDRDGLLEQISVELHVDEEALRKAVIYYYETLMVEFKELNGFAKGENANRDKASALMALSIVNHRPFRSRTGRCSFLETAIANEQLALRFASVFLDLVDDVDSDNELAIPPTVAMTLIYHFIRLGVLAREQTRSGGRLIATEPVVGWVVQSMQLLGLAFGTLHLDGGSAASA